MDPAVEARFARLEQAIEAIAAKVGATAAPAGGEGGTAAEGTDDDANKALEGNLEMEAPPGTADRARKARDSEYLGDSFQNTVALAEIIVPGITLPTFDRAAAPKKTFDSICKLRRTALDLAYSRPETRGLVDELNGGRALDTGKMTCDATRTLFLAVGAAQKRINGAAKDNRGAGQPGIGGGLGIAANRTVQSLADINKRNAEHYARSRK